jgi:acyl-CoA synthetase (AMP-forming)/AMP-acid ligase II
VTSFPPLPSTIPERTLPALLEAGVREAPDRPALIAASLLAGGEELSVTYAELARQARRLAAVLEDHGVTRGDRVVIMLRNTAAVEAHVAYHAAHHLGAIAVPVNTLYVGRELAYVLEFAAPAAVVFEPAFAEIMVAALPPGATPALLAVGDGAEVGEPLAPLLAAVQAEPAAAVLAEDDEADWIFTSGTTGHPKAVAFTHGAAVACGYEAVEFWRLVQTSVYQNAAPFFTSTGCHTNQLACLAARCTNVVDPEPVVEEIVKRAVRCGTTNMFLLTPLVAMLLRRLDDGRIASLDLGAVKHINYGGQAMPRAFHERVHQLFAVERGIGLAGSYGLTEGGTCGLTFDPEDHLEAVRRCGRYGLAMGNRTWMDWIDFRIVTEDDEDAAVDEVGEILLRAPSVMSRYVNNEPATAKALRDGWLHTGDMVLRDDAGFVYFVDRDNAMIRRGGMNISSVEVEGVAAEHPAVAEAAAVPRPNPVLAEDVHLVVALRPGAQVTEAELIEFCRGGLADYKVPRSVAFVDALPRTAMNRINRAELKEAAREGVSG